MALIEVRGLKKAFGDVVVLDGVDLDIERGEFVTLMGVSGSGKSLLVKMLIGLLPADAGTIRFDGEDVTHLPEHEWTPVRRRIGMLFQGAALFDSLSVGENVAYGLREQGELAPEAMAERVAESLAYVGMEGKEEVWPADLSSGMKKRVGLARAIATRPQVLLYDEPTTGLDPVNIARITDLILHLKETLHVTSVVVTHDMPSAFKLSDRIAMIQAGGVIFSGTPDELVRADDPRVRDFVEGTPPEDRGAPREGGP